jgi:DNA processing protein
MDQERLSLLALHFVPGIGDVLFKQLVSYCGEASQVFKMSKGKLEKIPGIGPVVADAVANGKSIDRAEAEFKKAEKENANILFYMDAAYPARLKVFEDSPAVLYTKGNVNLNTPKVVAIVGTRKATEYGKTFIDKLIEDLGTAQSADSKRACLRHRYTRAQAGSQTQSDHGGCFGKRIGCDLPRCP